MFILSERWFTFILYSYGLAAVICVVIVTMSEEIILSAITQRVVVKFFANGNIKAVEILHRLCAQFGEEKLLKAQVYSASNVSYGHTLIRERWKCVKFFYFLARL